MTGFSLAISACCGAALCFLTISPNLCTCCFTFSLLGVIKGLKPSDSPFLFFPVRCFPTGYCLREAKRLNYPGKCGILRTQRVWRKKMELTEELKDLLIKTGKQLKGSARRLFMARTVKTLGAGGASRAERD